MLDDVFNYLRLRQLNGNHCTVEFPTFVQQLAKPIEMVTAGGDLTNGHTRGSRTRLFVWSAADDGGLGCLASAYHEHMLNLPSVKSEGIHLDRLAYTLSTKQSSLPWKSYIVAGSMHELQQRLEGGMSKPVRSSSTRKLGFIFTGQGAQWYVMG